MAGNHGCFYRDARNITSNPKVYISLYSVDYDGIDESGISKWFD